jgi:hypothetical protein
MQATFNTAELSLNKGQTLELGTAARSVITGICGAVWLTRDGDLNDRVLGPGQSLTVNRDSHVLLSALGDARVRIEQKKSRHHNRAARVGRGLLVRYLRLLRALQRRQHVPGNESLAY